MEHLARMTRQLGADLWMLVRSITLLEDGVDNLPAGISFSMALRKRMNS
jgi:hypothetical protein